MLHSGFSRLERKLHVFEDSWCQTHSGNVNYCIWLSVKRTACNFLMACRDTNVKPVILTEIRAC